MQSGMAPSDRQSPQSVSGRAVGRRKTGVERGRIGQGQAAKRGHSPDAGLSHCSGPRRGAESTGGRGPLGWRCAQSPGSSTSRLERAWGSLLSSEDPAGAGRGGGRCFGPLQSP
jgi:hypothetical protein